MTLRQRRVPADELHGLLHRLRPEAVGRRVAGTTSSPRVARLRSRISARSMPSARAPASMFDSTAQLTWGVPKPRKAQAGVVWERIERARDAHVGHLVRARRGVLALGHDPLGDVGIGTQQVVALDVLEDESPVRVEAAAYADLGRDAAAGLERFVEREHQAHGTARLEGHECHQRLELDVLLAAEAAAGVGRVDAHLGQGQVEQPGHQPLQQVGVLDGRPDGDAVLVGRGREAVGLDGEVRDHGERVGLVDDDIGLGFRSSTSPHPKLAHGQDVAVAHARRPQAAARARAPAARPAQRLSRRCRRRAVPRTRPATRRAASSAASLVSAATAATGSPWNFVSPTASTGRSWNCGP